MFLSNCIAHFLLDMFVRVWSDVSIVINVVSVIAH